MFTIKDEVQNPEGISATDISFGDGTVAEAIAKKQDAETGKGLSTNDYTNDEKAKLAALPTNTALQSALDGKQDTGNYMAVGGTRAARWNYNNESKLYQLLTIQDDSARRAINIRENTKVITLHESTDGGTTWETLATFTADEDTGWKNLTVVNGSPSGNYFCRQKNGWVRVELDCNSLPTITKKSYTKLFNLPSGVTKPSRKISAVASISGGDKVVICVTNGGEVNAYNYNDTDATGTLTAQIIYPV